MDQGHGPFIEGHVLVEELRFVDREPDVVKPVSDQEVDVFLCEDGITSRIHYQGV